MNLQLISILILGFIQYLNFSNEVYFEDWFLDTYYYSLNEDLIKLYNLLENNKKQKKLIQKNFKLEIESES